MKHRSTYLFLGLVLAGGVALLAPHFAHAGFFTDTTVNIGVTLFQVVAYIMNAFVGFFLMLAGMLVNLTMQINLTVLDLGSSGAPSIVAIGWRVSRDIANLGFVLAMVVIAFATIIRYETYGARKLLVKLITAAILVNFSLTIAGVLIDFSTVLTSFFLSKIDRDSDPITRINNFTTKLVNAFGPQKYILGDTTDPLPPDPAETPSTAQAIGTAVLLSISGLLFSVAFTLIATIVLLTFAILLLVRYVWLTLLLITAPLAWLFSVIPELESNNKLWWSNFTKWTFFAPGMTFFVYLALASLDALQSHKINAATFWSNNIFATIMQQGTQGIVLCGILIGGLIMAQKTGSKVGAAGMGAASGLWSGTKTFASARARQFGQNLAASRVGGGAAKGAAAVGSGLRRIGLKGAAGSIERAGDRVEKLATAPKVQHTGLMSSLMGGAAGATGLYKPAERPRKLEDKSQNELLEDREDLIRRKKSLESAGTFSPKAMADVEAQIKTTEGALEKRYGEEPKTSSDWGKREENLKKDMNTLQSRGGDTSFHKKAIANAIKKKTETMEDSTLNDQLAKIGAFEALLNGGDKDIEDLRAKIVAEPGDKKHVEDLKTKLAYYERKINEVENKIEPKDEEALNKKIDRIQKRRTEIIQKLGLDEKHNVRANTANFDAQLSRARRALDSISDAKEVRPIQFALEQTLDTLQSQVDKDIAAGTYTPNLSNPHANDATITAIKNELKTWRSLSTKKPKTAAQWDAHKTALIEARKKANDNKFATTEINTAIDNLIAEADTELTKATDTAKKPPQSQGGQQYSGEWTTT